MESHESIAATFNRESLSCHRDKVKVDAPHTHQSSHFLLIIIT